MLFKKQQNSRKQRNFKTRDVVSRGNKHVPNTKKLSPSSEVLGQESSPDVRTEDLLLVHGFWGNLKQIQNLLKELRW